MLVCEKAVPSRMIGRAAVLQIFLLFITCASASANVAPEASIFVHVQSVDPDYCATCPITSCEQIEQYSPLLGQLEFDLFYHTMFEIGQPEELYLVVELPEDWSYVGFERCVPGYGGAEVSGNVIEILLMPTIDLGSFDLVGRLVLEAPDFGRLRHVDGYVITDDAVEHFLFGFGGEAGRECGTCIVSCDNDYYCSPGLNPDELDLEVAAGSTTTAVLMGYAQNPTSGPCAADFMVSEPWWMEIEVLELELGTYEITLTIDAAELSPGDYQGWIENSTADCSRCAEVEVFVTEEVPIRARTWGYLKGLYR